MNASETYLHARRPEHAGMIAGRADALRISMHSMMMESVHSVKPESRFSFLQAGMPIKNRLRRGAGRRYEMHQLITGYDDS